MSEHRSVEVRPIHINDIGRVAEFLTANLNARVSERAWMDAMARQWVDAPNYGFMLQAGDDLIGTYLAFYSERRFEGQVELFCNLGAWCVLEEYRSHGLRLIRSMLTQRGYTFTDLSPSGNVVALNQRLRFSSLDTAAVAVPCLPWPIPDRRITVTSDQTQMGRALTGQDLQIFSDHADAAAVHHLLVTSGQESCYIMLRRDRRKRLPIFGSVLFVSNPGLFHRSVRQVSQHLLLRHRVLVMLAELRVVGGPIGGSVKVRAPRPKMFKSATVRSDQVDYLYSELTNVAW